MAEEHLTGSRILTGFAAEPLSPADVGWAGGRVRYWSETVEVSAGASVNSTYRLARLPAAARLTSLCVFHHDDLASAGAPVMDVGVFNPAGKTGITDDDDALIGGGSVATAAAVAFPADIAKVGRRLWEFVAGQTADPRHELEIRATLKTAAANTGGTLTLELFYTVD